MYRTPIFTPRLYYPRMVPPITKPIGLFTRVGNTFNAVKSINWSGLINNTSKTLGIINQTIPLVRQVGPMVGNMRSMLKVASVFKDETDTTFNHNITPNINKQQNPTKNTNYTSNNTYNPSFFIN